jgi:hypothetical protein
MEALVSGSMSNPTCPPSSRELSVQRTWGDLARTSHLRFEPSTLVFNVTNSNYSSFLICPPRHGGISAEPCTPLHNQHLPDLPCRIRKLRSLHDFSNCISPVWPLEDVESYRLPAGTADPKRKRAPHDFNVFFPNVCESTRWTLGTHFIGPESMVFQLPNSMTSRLQLITSEVLELLTELYTPPPPFLKYILHISYSTAQKLYTVSQLYKTYFLQSEDLHYAIPSFLFQGRCRLVQWNEHYVL